MRVLALDVPHVLDEKKLVRPKSLKTDLGENVNPKIVEDKRGSSKTVDVFHNMKTVESRSALDQNTSWVIRLDTPGEDLFKQGD